MNIPAKIRNLKGQIHTISWEIAELEGVLETNISSLEWATTSDRINGLLKKSARLKLSLDKLEAKVAEFNALADLYHGRESV